MGYFIMNLNEINPDIIKKIDSLDIKKSEKDFFKEALIEEYNHRDKQNYDFSDKKNPKYDEIIGKYYER